MTIADNVARRNEYQYDVFICHASEDKDVFVRPLVKELEHLSLSVWYDEISLTLGDSLRCSIDRGLSESRFGVVILSHAFFSKNWPRRELDGLAAREIGEGRKIVLPVWYKVVEEDVRKYSPPLADKVSVSAAKGVKFVAEEILRAIHQSYCQENKRESLSKIPKSLIVDNSGDIFLLDDHFYTAISFVEDTSGDIIVEVYSGGSEDDSHFRQLMESSIYQKQVSFAYRNDGGFYLIRSIDSVVSGQKQKWILKLQPIDDVGNLNGRISYNNGTSTYDVIQIVKLKARRILLNEQQNISNEILESVIRGFGNTSSSYESLFPKLYKDIGDKNIELFLRQARLMGIFQLKVNRIVKHVFQLSLGPVEGRKMGVKFRGKYDNVEQVIIEVDGKCLL